jgi:hypothetical protein
MATEVDVSDAGESQVNKLAEAVRAEINLARYDPPAYSIHVSPLMHYFHGNVLKVPGKPPMEMDEGPAGVEDAVKWLRDRIKSPPLERVSTGLCQAAADHVNDLGLSGGVGHKGSDGSTAFDRISRYGAWQKAAGENFAFGEGDVRWMVILMIIDDGRPSKELRMNLFNSRYRLVGAAEGAHPSRGRVHVQTFAAEYDETVRGIDKIGRALTAASIRAPKPGTARVEKPTHANGVTLPPEKEPVPVSQISDRRLRRQKERELKAEAREEARRKESEVHTEVVSKRVVKDANRKTMTTTTVVTLPDGTKQTHTETKVHIYYEKPKVPDVITERDEEELAEGVPE